MDASSVKLQNSPFLSTQNKGFGKCASFYSYCILTPIDGDTIVTPIFYLNGSEKTAHIEIKWGRGIFKFRLVTEYERELFNVIPYIRKICISQDGINNMVKRVYNVEDMDEESWLKCIRPILHNPIFIKFQFCFVYHESKTKPDKIIPFKMDLYERLNKMYREKIYADFIIKIDGVEFLTHKVILAARSPVFADLFDNNEEIKSGNVFVINGIRPHAFDIFLKYLYLNEINTVKKTDPNLILELIKISIIYKVDDFKLEMCKLATYTFTPENIRLWIVNAYSMDLQYVRNMAMSCIQQCINAKIPNF